MYAANSWVFISTLEPPPELQALHSNCLLSISTWISNRYLFLTYNDQDWILDSLDSLPPLNTFLLYFQRQWIITLVFLALGVIFNSLLFFSHILSTSSSSGNTVDRHLKSFQNQAISYSLCLQAQLVSYGQTSLVGYRPWGSQKVRQDWVTSLNFTIWINLKNIMLSLKSQSFLCVTILHYLCCIIPLIWNVQNEQIYKHSQQVGHCLGLEGGRWTGGNGK